VSYLRAAGAGGRHDFGILEKSMNGSSSPAARASSICS
jgi:hypothetical protein